MYSEERFGELLCEPAMPLATDDKIGEDETYRATSRPSPRQTTALLTRGNFAMVRVIYSGVILYRPKLASVTVITNQSSEEPVSTTNR